MTLQVGSVLLGDSWFVYGLFETDSGATRYIGKTHHPYVRYYTHMSLTPGVRASFVRDWVASVKARGAQVGLRILAVCETNEEACHVEMALISQMKDSLVNTCAVNKPIKRRTQQEITGIPAAYAQHSPVQREVKVAEPAILAPEPPPPGASIAQKVAYAKASQLGAPKPQRRKYSKST